MAFGEDTKKLLAVKLKNLPVDTAEKLDEAIGQAKHFNGGYATLTVFVKRGIVPIVDVLMRHFMHDKEECA
jgi:hypothetical protein